MASTNEISQIDQINKALTLLNGTLDQTSAKYLTIVKNINDSQATVKLTVQTQENLNKAQKETAGTTQKLDELGKQLEASEKKLKQTEDERLKTIIQNRIATSEATKAITDKVKAEQAEEGSLVRMRQKLAELTAQYDKAGTRTKEAAKEIDNLSREIGKAEEATNRHQRGVGGYADQLGHLSGQLSNLPGPIGEAASGFEELLSKLKAFGPWGAVVAGGLLALSAPLVAFFTKTEEGMDMMEQKVAGVKAAFAVLTGELIKGGKAMVDMVDKPDNKVSMFYSKLLTFVAGASPKILALGARMDSASMIAQNVVKEQQKLEDKESSMIVARAKATEQIKQARLIYAQANLPIQERISALAKALDLEGKTAEKEIEHQNEVVGQLNIIKEEKLKVGQWLRSDEKKLQEAIAKTIELSSDSTGRQVRASTALKAAKKELTSEAEALDKEAFDKRVASVEAANKIEIQLINNKLINRTITEEQHKKELENQEIRFLNAKQALYAKDSKEWADVEIQKQNISIKVREEILKDIKSKGKLMTSAERKIAEDTKIAIEKDQKNGLKSNQAYLDAKLKQAKDEAEKQQKIEDEIKKKKELTKELQIRMGVEVVSAAFAANQTKLSNELSSLEKEKDIKLKNTHLTAGQKAKIEEDYAKKEAAIKTKQAQNDKKKAIFDIAIETAIGAMRAAAEFPLTGGMPFLAWVIAMGALQSGLVAAQPLPKYAKGTQSAERVGIFGEAGRELMVLPSGGSMIADKPTYFEGGKFKGAKIYSNTETERLMSMVGNRNIIVKNQNDNRIIEGLEKLNRTILNKPVAIYDKDHRQIGLGNSQHQEIYLNRLINRNE